MGLMTELDEYCPVSTGALGFEMLNILIAAAPPYIVLR